MLDKWLPRIHEGDRAEAHASGFAADASDAREGRNKLRGAPSARGRAENTTFMRIRCLCDAYVCVFVSCLLVHVYVTYNIYKSTL